MVKQESVTGITVEFVEFPPWLTPPEATNRFFLAGAGVRGLNINGEFVTFTGIGIYLEEKAIPNLAAKWKGKTPEELFNALDFYRDIIKGPFEKIIQSTKLKTLDGPEYVRKVSENCVAFMKSEGTYGEAEEKAVEEFKAAFNGHSFPPGKTLFYRQYPNGSIGLSFAEDAKVPVKEQCVVENKAVSEAPLETMIGEIPVSPALKQSLATRIALFINEEPL